MTSLDDTTDRNDYSKVGRSMSSGERKRVDSKIEKNKDRIHQQEIDIVSLSKDVDALAAAVKSGNEAQDVAFGHMEERQEINTVAIASIQSEAKEERRRNEQRHAEVLEAVLSLTSLTSELDKRTTPPPRDSVSSMVAVAAPSAPLASPVHPLTIPQQASLYQQMSATQKGGAAAAGVVSVPAILLMIYQMLAPYFGG